MKRCFKKKMSAPKRLIGFISLISLLSFLLEYHHQNGKYETKTQRIA